MSDNFSLTLSNSSMQQMPLSANMRAPASTQNSPTCYIGQNKCQKKIEQIIEGKWRLKQKKNRNKKNKKKHKKKQKQSEDIQILI